jgi:hypothetical protein
MQPVSDSVISSTYDVDHYKLLADSHSHFLVNIKVVVIKIAADSTQIALTDEQLRVNVKNIRSAILNSRRTVLQKGKQVTIQVKHKRRLFL